MKTRNGFVSNSSSSSFIIADIDKRGDLLTDFPPMSSLTEYYDNWLKTASYKTKFPNKKAKDVYQISASSGKIYDIDEVYKVIKKHGYKAKKLTAYDDNWKKYLNDFSCIIIDIRNCKHEDVPTIVDMQWGGDYIWNTCSFCFDGGNVCSTDVKHTSTYSKSPFFRYIINSDEYKEWSDKVKKASEEYDVQIKEYWKECTEFDLGNREKAPEFPEMSELSRMFIGDIVCKICHKHDANICFNVNEAIDKGCIYIYAEENYLSYECIDELKNNFQCIMYSEHMG